ncbi:lysozyme, partial [Escherichia coli]|uniref:lysozyme n=1 Tax=Escherichia coli TaxID=562 RepID=UPI000D0B40BA
MNKTGAVGAICSVAVIIGLVLSNGEVKTSRAGLELIGNAEGCRRDPYKCPADVLTDGIGNTHGVKQGVRKSDQQIAADWQKNILAAERCVTNYAAGGKLPQGAFDAAVSITFNAGCATMQKSTMFRLFRQ